MRLPGIYSYGNYISIYGFLNIRTSILDYLGEGFPWPAQPFKHTESNSFKHTATTFKYTNWIELVFHTTSGALPSGPPSTYLNLFTVYTRIYKVKSADPGLGQGRGGAWDHRRCGTSPSSLSKVKPISQPASCPKATSRKHFPGMLRPPVKTSRHLDMKITCFGKPLKRWLGMLHPAANSHPEATHQWLLMGRLNNPLACFILQPTGTPRPHINGFLWASKPAVCQPLNPPNPPNP